MEARNLAFGAVPPVDLIAAILRMGLAWRIEAQAYRGLL